MKIGILTDIHENKTCLERAIRSASNNRCDELACLGDIAGYDNRFYNYREKRSAAACIELIRSNCKWIVAGNHDLFAAQKFPAYTNGLLFPENWFSLNAAQKKIASAGKVWCYEGDEPNDLSEEDQEFIGNLPEYLILKEAGGILLSHYIYPDFSGSTTNYINRRQQFNGLWGFMQQNNVIYSFTGHAHQMFTGFAYQKSASLFKAIHTNPNSHFNLGNERVMVALPPLSGEKGKSGFSIFDTESLRLSTIYLPNS
jgi:predicted phosphodiesterase